MANKDSCNKCHTQLKNDFVELYIAVAKVHIRLKEFNCADFPDGLEDKVQNMIANTNHILEDVNAAVKILNSLDPSRGE